MHAHPFTLTSRDDHTITGTLFQPADPASVLVIAHGMAEHAGRYTDFARWLGTRGIAVVTYHHRGHGDQGPTEKLGHYSDNDGWAKVTDDLYRVISQARTTFPDLPLTLLGHSMGSFIAQSLAQQHPGAIDALILSASNRIHRPQLLVSRCLVGAIRGLRGRRHRSALITRLTFGQFNRRFQPTRTDCDWLSRDPRQVDAYRADPACGFDCSVGLWYDFLGGMLAIDPRRWRKDLPVHLFGGSEDPVGEMGQGLTRHFRAIREAGVQRVTLRLFAGGRHEMLNETNADEVWAHVAALCQPAHADAAPA